MTNFIKPYNDDPFVGHLVTPITSSAATRVLLQNLPAYRLGLTPLLRGLEIGLAHGYFLMGPFVKLGPLRDSDVALLAGFLSTIGLIVILTLGLTIYGIATFGQEKSFSVEENSFNLQTRKAWNQFKGGFFCWCVRKRRICFYLLIKYSNLYSELTISYSISIRSVRL